MHDGLCGIAETVSRFWLQTQISNAYSLPPTFNSDSQFSQLKNLRQNRKVGFPVLPLRHFLVWHTLFTSFTLFPYLARGKDLSQHGKNSFPVLANWPKRCRITCERVTHSSSPSFWGKDLGQNRLVGFGGVEFWGYALVGGDGGQNRINR
jgi:hypothetical protein